MFLNNLKPPSKKHTHYIFVLDNLRKTYFWSPVQFLHQKCTTVLHSSESVVQKPPSHSNKHKLQQRERDTHTHTHTHTHTQTHTLTHTHTHTHTQRDTQTHTHSESWDWNTFTGSVFFCVWAFSRLFCSRRFFHRESLCIDTCFSAPSL